MASTSIVVAFTHKTFGIGKNGSIPWHIVEDLVHFRKLTKNGIIVMGRKTFNSIGKILNDRFNIVLSKSPPMKHLENSPNLAFVSSHDYLELISKDLFVIGGSDIYKLFIGKAKYIFATVIEKEYECDIFFPNNKMYMYEIEDVSNLKFSESGNCTFYHVKYRLADKQCSEQGYLNLLSEILKDGATRPDRTGTGTRALFGRQLKFDLCGFKIPLVTTKFIPWKTVVKELLWFLRGDSNNQHLQSDGVNIWNGNTSRDFLDKRGLTSYPVGDTGPLYSHALRHFGAKYTDCNTDYSGKGVDQIALLIDGLKNDPFSRRHLITTFNPAVVDECVLMPCHGIAIQFFVGIDNTLSCHVYCRSCDMFLGLPFNIASYAFLTHIIAQSVGLRANELTLSTGDSHIYTNHLDQVKEQLQRNPFPSPILKLSDRISFMHADFNELTIDDFQVSAYLHHPAIKGVMSI
jgi:dihydrofolate reductase/thymidylate synthase